MRSRVGEPEHHACIREHLCDDGEVLVEDRPVQDHPAIGCDTEVDIRLDGTLAGSLRMCGEAVGRIAVVTSSDFRSENKELAHSFESGPAITTVNQGSAHMTLTHESNPFARIEAGKRPPSGPIVERGAMVEGEDHTDPARRCLGKQSRARSVCRGNEVERLPPQLRIGERVREIECERSTRCTTHRCHQRHLGTGPLQTLPYAIESGSAAEDPATMTPEHFGQRHKFVFRRPRAGHIASIMSHVTTGPRRGEPDRSGTHRLVDQFHHDREFVIGRIGASIE